MPVTGLRGRQIRDGDVFRSDLNITTSGSAVTRRIIAGTNVTIASTGVDTGTGDVTINAAITGAALTRTNDTNVTLTLGGSASTALVNAASLTLGWTGQLAVGRGGTGASTLTGVLVGNGTSAITGVVGTASQLLRRNAGNTAYEFFSAGNLTRTDDTNVTLTLGGTPTGALINAVSLTLGWTGQLAVGRGGTGASTLTGVAIGNGTSAMTAVAGTASQLLRRNAGNTAYEFFTHDFLSTGGGTLTGNLIFANGTSPFTGYIQFGDNSGWVFRFMTNVSGTPTARFSFRDDGTLTATGQYITTRANFAGDGLGQIFLNGTNANRIDWNTQGVAAPSFTTRSLGTKLVLYPAINATQVDYALGIDSDTMWFSTAVAGGTFRWYGGTTINMRLVGPNLLLTGNYWSNGQELIGSDGTSNYIQTGAILYFNTGVTNHMRLTNAGSVTIGNTASTPSKLFVFNTNDLIPDYQITHQSAATTMPTSSPIIITNLHSSGSFGHNLYITSSAATGTWEYNFTKTWDGVLTFGVSPNGTTLTRHFYMYSSGQIRFANYTATTSFSGTAVGVLAFDLLGNIITIPTPGGGSGLTGSGTTNYVPKFTGATSVGNSVIFDNGTDIGINTATPTTLANYKTIDFIGGSVGALIRFSDSTATFRGAIYGSTAEMAINAVATFNLYVNSTQIVNADTTTINVATATGFAIGNRTNRRRIQFDTGSFSILNDGNGYANLIGGTINAQAAGAQLRISGGGTESGIFMSQANNFLLVADWASGVNGIAIDVSNGILRTRSSAAGGAYIQFERSASTIYGYVGNASGLIGTVGFNANTDLAIRSEANINFATSSTAIAQLNTNGRLTLRTYTATNSHTGTLVGFLAFDNSGNIITTAAPGGTSQWITNGTAIYYNGGNVGIGTNTTPSDRLEISTASGTAPYIRFNQATRATWRLGQRASQDSLVLENFTATTTAFEVSSNLQLRLNAYTSFSSFNNTDAQGALYYDTSGNIMGGVPPIYRITFTAAGNFTLTNQASALQFFNNQTAYIARADLTGYRRVRLHVQKGGTAGATNSRIILRYRTTYSNTTTDYSNIGTSEVSVAINTSNVYLTTSWIDLATPARGDVFVALMMSGGDGAADPIVGNIYAEFDF